MAELETAEQVTAYLAEMSPSVEYHVQPFPSGWLCTRVLSREEMERDAGLGLARLVVDSETGIVYVYPSWSELMVVEAFTEFKQTGVNRAGRRIYPYQRSIAIHRIREDETTIEYQLTAESLNDPPEPTQHISMTVEKRTLAYEPRNSFTRVAISRTEAESRSNQGIWPETATTQV